MSTEKSVDFRRSSSTRDDVPRWARDAVEGWSWGSTGQFRRPTGVRGSRPSGARRDGASAGDDRSAPRRGRGGSRESQRPGRARGPSRSDRAAISGLPADGSGMPRVPGLRSASGSRISCKVSAFSIAIDPRTDQPLAPIEDAAEPGAGFELLGKGRDVKQDRAGLGEAGQVVEAARPARIPGDGARLDRGPGCAATIARRRARFWDRRIVVSSGLRVARSSPKEDGPPPPLVEAWAGRKGPPPQCRLGCF